jgi:O-antigen ligase
MPEHLRALVVILVLAGTVFALARPHVCAAAMAPADFARRRNLWFALTLAAFLAHNFWAYAVFAAAVLLLTAPREPNRLAMFFFLLFAVPAIPAQIGGLGLINYFFEIHHVRLLALALLLPACLALWLRPEVERFGRTLPDKLLAGYLILQFFLQLQADSFTNTLRSGAFYAFTDVFLPYYVASRALRDLTAFRDALAAFVIAAMAVGALGVFETLKHWNLYNALQGALGATWEGGAYLHREGVLRARASVGHPIALGYALAVALGFYLYLWQAMPRRRWRFAGLAVLLAGLLASLSRGPWMGAIVMAAVFALTARVDGARIAALGLAGAAGLVTVFAADDLAALLPFLSAIDQGTVSYRQQLLEVAIAELWRNPWFGGFDRFSPAMEELRQGQGIIDIVNSYVGVGLASGAVGLALFVGFFLASVLGALQALRRMRDRTSERYRLGRALAATLAGIMVIIFTVSSISIIPVVYWSVAGIAVGFALMVRRERAAARAAAPAPAGLARGGATA